MNDIFGYLKPYNNELKLKDINKYRTLYCTVCYGLKSNTGLISSTLLNYECVFLYVLLDGLNNTFSDKQVQFRCQMNPLKKVSSKVNAELLEYVSFINYSLAVVKMIDNCRDSKNIFYKIVLYILRINKKYRKLLIKYSDIHNSLCEKYDKLYALEKKASKNFDDYSFLMGNLLRDVVKCSPLCISDENILRFALHIGMWIYLIDAFDDYEKDVKKHNFNPISSVCVNRKGDFDDLEYGEAMLSMMLRNINKFLEQIEFSDHSEIIKNIVEFSMPNAVYGIKRRRGKKCSKCQKNNLGEGK